MSEKEETINSFLAMTESKDYGAAFEYLEKNDWDLSKAVDQFINTHNFRQDNHGMNSNSQNHPNPTTGAPGEGQFEYTPLDENMQHPQMSGFGMGMGIPEMNEPNLNRQPANREESLIGGAMSGLSSFFSNIGSSIKNVVGSPFSGGNEANNHNNDQEMTIDNTKTFGRIFLEKFRSKNGMSIELPPFVDGDFDEIVQEAKRLKRPIFIYVHNHKGDSCTIVDQTVLGEEVVKELLSKFICVGVNLHSEVGQDLLRDYNIPGAPYMAMMYFDDNDVLQNIGSRYSSEINVNSLFEMTDTAHDMMASLFSPDHGIENFNVADSNLGPLETPEIKAEIEENLQNIQATGFTESRRREPQIDPNTGLPFGLTEQQYEDRLLKEQQRTELQEAMEADRRKLEEHKEKQEEEKQKHKEEIERKAVQEKQQKDREAAAEQLRDALPDEPAENDPNACTVHFRLPDGSQTIQRRFLRTDKIQLLYDYIYSLGTEIGYEGHAGHFTIIQNLPKKIFEDMESTLEAEGLYPRCKLYVRENSQSS